MDEVALELVFLRVLRFYPANNYSTIAPYSSITAPRGVRYPDQPAHYNTWVPKVGASYLTRHLAGLGVKVVYKSRRSVKVDILF
jgi:hypothetical protein